MSRRPRATALALLLGTFLLGGCVYYNGMYNTNRLAKFVNSLSLKFQATIGVTPEEREQAERILNSGQDRALLKIMREQTTILVLMLRVENQARRKEWEEEWEMEHAEPDAAGGYAKLDLFSSTED